MTDQDTISRAFTIAVCFIVAAATAASVAGLTNAVGLAIVKSHEGLCVCAEQDEVAP